MLVKEVMSSKVDVASPEWTLEKAARHMRDGDYGFLPVGENDRLIGMITDRDIAIRAVAEGKDPRQCKVRDCMTSKVLYCYEDQSTDEVAQNMGQNQVRRLPVLNREKRLVGILSLADLAQKAQPEHAKEALSKVSQPEHREPQETRVH
jgi:CBS domain-containing protein